MLAYRHAFHAGNASDVLKHALLAFCLDHLGRKKKPYWYIDTHGGAGLYTLKEGYAAVNREWERGILRIWDGEDLPAMLARYRDLVRGEQAGDGLDLYPGSPVIAQKLLRQDDQGFCYEMHGADFSILEEVLKEDRRFTIRRENGLDALKSLLPPPSRRGCVFIDPSYELSLDYRSLGPALEEGLGRFPQGLYIIWYPLLERKAAHSLPETLMGLYAGNRCRAEMVTAERPGPGSRGLYGCGLVVYNPPWTLREALEQSLPFLARLLGGVFGSSTLQWETAP